MVAEIQAALGDPGLDELITAPLHEQLADDIELLDGASYEFDLEAVQSGRLSPVFFGSALTNFGVEPFLADFLRLSTPPLPRNSDIGLIDPMHPDFSGFIFKIQANMNKAHRDRIAFLRITRGQFDPGHGGVPCPGRQKGETGPVHPAHGPGPRHRGRGLRRRHRGSV